MNEKKRYLSNCCVKITGVYSSHKILVILSLIYDKLFSSLSIHQGVRELVASAKSIQDLRTAVERLKTDCQVFCETTV